MKNRLSLLFLLFITPCAHSLFAQGTNNDFDYDRADLVYLFEKMGYGVFKFPARQSRAQPLDVIVEEYRDGRLTQTQSVILRAQKNFDDYGVAIDIKNNLTPRKDSVFLHRFYTQQTDSVLSIDIKTHGVSLSFAFDIADLATANFRARYETKEEIAEKGFLEVTTKTPLLFFYANRDPDQPLWCPAGMPPKMVTERFYYAVFVYLVPAE